MTIIGVERCGRVSVTRLSLVGIHHRMVLGILSQCGLDVGLTPRLLVPHLTRIGSSAIRMRWDS